MANWTGPARGLMRAALDPIRGKTGGMGNVGKAAGKSHPVSSHPLFPLVVAMWSAALFGLGSLAIRPALVETMVQSVRIDALIPATAPPLGVFARIMLALMLAAAGSVIGLMLGRRISLSAARPRARQRRTDHVNAPADLAIAALPRRPIQAREDLDHESFDAVIDAEFEPVPEPDEPEAVMSPTDNDLTVPLAPRQMLVSSAAAGESDPSGLAAIAGSPRQEANAGVNPDAESIQPASPLTASAVGATGDTGPGELGRLSMIELAERLACAMQRHRDARAEQDSTTAAPPATATDDEGDEEFELPRLLAESPPATITLFDEAISGEDEEADETAYSDAYSSLLGIGREAAVRQQSVRIEDEPQPNSEAIEPVVIFPGQSPAVQQLGPRLFDPPGTLAESAKATASAPIATPGDPAETERALRAALASLQRMTGAA